MLQIILAVSLLAALAVDAMEAPGTLIVTQFASAPFPHPDRVKGHRYYDDFFSAAEHYRDSSVALFVPRDFHAGTNVDFVVHFHGWNNTATNALEKYRLIEQFTGSARNAILIVPQGPRNAKDSFGGKLEDPGGFERFMGEAMRTLRERGLIGDAGMGRIILSAHSGGYEVVSSIIARGGLTEHVCEVWLFDALYGHAAEFALWFERQRGRFIDLYTEHGGTKAETENLMTKLRENGAAFYAGTEIGVTVNELRGNHLIFLFSQLPHDEVLQGHETFRAFLETSALEPLKTIYKPEAKP